jgi:hypothetical protein
MDVPGFLRGYFVFLRPRFVNGIFFSFCGEGGSHVEPNQYHQYINSFCCFPLIFSWGPKESALSEKNGLWKPNMGGVKKKNER